jgi:hypothetical protein
MPLDGNHLVGRQALAHQPIPATAIEEIGVRAAWDEVRMQDL